MLVGWASARFGLLGLNAQPLSNPTLNTVGVLIAVLALGVFAFIKPSVGKQATKRAGGLLDNEHDAAYAGLYSAVDDLDKLASVNDGVGAEDEGVEAAEPDWTDKLSPSQKTIFGFSASAPPGAPDWRSVAMVDPFADAGAA